MKRHIEPIAAFLLFIGFFLVLGCAGASDCNRPFPIPIFLIGCACMLISFILINFVVKYK